MRGLNSLVIGKTKLVIFDWLMEVFVFIY
jgi:hypothetical protein